MAEKYGLLIDYTWCTGCHSCEMACKDYNDLPASYAFRRVFDYEGGDWKDNGDGTHTCPDCGATEGQPFNTNSALELRVVDAEGMNEPFTVSQNGTLRTYTGAYDTATLTGDLNTLRYLQDHGAPSSSSPMARPAALPSTTCWHRAAAARCSTSPTVGPKSPPCCWWRQTTANW